jgi:hypothetical protein
MGGYWVGGEKLLWGDEVEKCLAEWVNHVQVRTVITAILKVKGNFVPMLN